MTNQYTRDSRRAEVVGEAARQWLVRSMWEGLVAIRAVCPRASKPAEPGGPEIHRAGCSWRPRAFYGFQ